MADAAALAKLHDEQGCTLQVIQPQRWEDKTWRIVAALEAQMGCLVGAWGVCVGGRERGSVGRPVQPFVINQPFPFHTCRATGANAYLTPRGTQGLAPHTDPVEIFVVQTQGRKRWRLYQPVGGFPLPNQASGDLEQVRSMDDDSSVRRSLIDRWIGGTGRVGHGMA